MTPAGHAAIIFGGNHCECENGIHADAVDVSLDALVALAERATELERELDKLRVWANGINSQRDVYAGQTTKWKGRWERTDDERQAQHQRAEQLETALRKYGRHTTKCRYETTRYGGTLEPCDCGLDAALDGGTAT